MGIQADTIIPEPGNPQALNRYSYVSNNPLKYTDPTGHVKKCTGECDEANWTPPNAVKEVFPVKGKHITSQPLYGDAQLGLANMVYLEEGPGGSARSRTAAAYVAWNKAGSDLSTLLSQVLPSGSYAYEGPWMPEGAVPTIWNDILGIVASVMKYRAPDETGGATFFANIIKTYVERRRYEDTLAYWVQTNLDSTLSRDEALVRAGYLEIPRGDDSLYIFVMNRVTSVPVPNYRVPDDQYHAPLNVSTH